MNYVHRKMPKYVLSLGVYWTWLYMIYNWKKKKGGGGVKYKRPFLFLILKVEHVLTQHRAFSMQLTTEICGPNSPR